MWSTSGHWSQIQISENTKQKAKTTWLEGKQIVLFISTFILICISNFVNQKLFNTSSKKKRTGGRERPNLATQPSGPTNSPLCTTARLKPPLPTSAYKGNKWHKMFRTPEFYSARKKLAALCNPLYLGMKHLYKKCPPLWYGHFGAVFSCPGQLNRWPWHSLSKWLIFWF